MKKIIALALLGVGIGMYGVHGQEGFSSEIGVVTAVEAFYNADQSIDPGKMFLSVTGDQSEATFFISEDTIVVNQEEAIKEGDVVVGYYDDTLPMIAIYPPRYNLVVALVNISDTVLADQADLVEAAQQLQAQLAQSSDVENLEPELDFSEVEALIVNDETIVQPTFFHNDEGALMVPVRVVAEALGYEVTYEAQTKTVFLGPISYFAIGSDYYTFMRMSPFSLGTAPTIVEDRAFVPITYFSTVLRHSISIENQHAIITQ